MKLIILLSGLLVLTTSYAQTRSDVKIYGYVQPVIGGANPQEMPNESGVNATTATERKNYFLYISAPKGQKIYPIEIWIEGKRYSTRTTSVSSTPVVMAIQTGETDPKKVTLVPKTSSAVYQVTPASGNPSKMIQSAKFQSTKNDVVISYKLGGKFYYAALKTLSPLEAAALQ